MIKQSVTDILIDHPEFNKEKFLKTNPQLKEVVEKEAVVANEALVAVEALPLKDAVKVDEFSHLAAVLLYTSGCPFVGPDIRTSDKPDKVCVITDPPPPDPPRASQRHVGGCQETSSAARLISIRAFVPVTQVN